MTIIPAGSFFVKAPSNAGLGMENAPCTQCSAGRIAGRAAARPYTFPRICSDADSGRTHFFNASRISSWGIFFFPGRGPSGGQKAGHQQNFHESGFPQNLSFLFQASGKHEIPAHIHPGLRVQGPGIGADIVLHRLRGGPSPQDDIPAFPQVLFRQ